MTADFLTADHRNRIAQEKPSLLSTERLTSRWEEMLCDVAPLLRRLARGAVAPDDVEDIMQDAVLRAVRHPPTLNGPCPRRQFRAWIARVLERLVVDRSRRRKHRRRADNLDAVVAAGREPVDPQPGPARALEQREAAERLHAELGRRGMHERVQAALRQLCQLPDGQTNAQILSLRLLEGRTAGQVARALGMTARAVRMRHCRAIRKLRPMPRLAVITVFWEHH
jgi:RNA polymerase sigma factor (sigma-70 family)